MAIKITETDFTDDSISYPCLMAGRIGNKKQIILVTGVKEHEHTGKNYVGTNVNGVGYDVGYYSDSWVYDQFKPFYGQVIIESKHKQEE